MKREETTMLLLYNLYKDGSGIVVAVFTDFAFILCSFFCGFAVFGDALCVIWYHWWEAVCGFHVNLKQFFGFGTF